LGRLCFSDCEPTAGSPARYEDRPTTAPGAITMSRHSDNEADNSDDIHGGGIDDAEDYYQLLIIYK
jgi:hypothetical protein